MEFVHISDSQSKLHSPLEEFELPTIINQILPIVMFQNLAKYHEFSTKNFFGQILLKFKGFSIKKLAKFQNNFVNNYSK